MPSNRGGPSESTESSEHWTALKCIKTLIHHPFFHILFIDRASKSSFHAVGVSGAHAKPPFCQPDALGNMYFGIANLCSCEKQRERDAHTRLQLLRLRFVLAFDPCPGRRSHRNHPCHDPRRLKPVVQCYFLSG